MGLEQAHGRGLAEAGITYDLATPMGLTVPPGLGLKDYGFEPYAPRAQDTDRAHGNDERISIACLCAGLDLQLAVA